MANLGHLSMEICTAIVEIQGQLALSRICTRVTEIRAHVPEIIRLSKECASRT